MAAELGARQPVRVPRHVGPLGAGRAARAHRRRRLPRRRAPPGARARSACDASPSASPRASRATSPSPATWPSRRRPRSGRRPSASPASTSARSPTPPSSRSARPRAWPPASPAAARCPTAADLARFYQALLRNDRGLWDPDVLADAVGNVRNTFPDPQTGVPANRALSIVLAGDDGKGGMRGMGHTASPQAFGHNGAGGQIAFADPATGISFCWFTNGLDRHLHPPVAAVRRHRVQGRGRRPGVERLTACNASRAWTPPSSTWRRRPPTPTSSARWSSTPRPRRFPTATSGSSTCSRERIHLLEPFRRRLVPGAVQPVAPDVDRGPRVRRREPHPPHGRPAAGLDARARRRRRRRGRPPARPHEAAVGAVGRRGPRGRPAGDGDEDAPRRHRRRHRRRPDGPPVRPHARRRSAAAARGPVAARGEAVGRRARRPAPCSTTSATRPRMAKVVRRTVKRRHRRRPPAARGGRRGSPAAGDAVHRAAGALVGGDHAAPRRRLRQGGPRRHEGREVDVRHDRERRRAGGHRR